MNISAIKIGDKAYWRLILVIGFLSFFLILYRSIILSITYDEVWTYHLSSQSIYQICYAPENFSSANNHVLNSIDQAICTFVWSQRMGLEIAECVVFWVLLCRTCLVDANVDETKFHSIGGYNSPLFAQLCVGFLFFVEGLWLGFRV